MRKVFLSTVALLCALLAAGTAGADVFYTTESGSSGALRTIAIESAVSIDKPSTLVSGLGTSLDVSTFGVDGGTRVMVTQRSATSNDTASIYIPGTWNSSTDVTLTGTRNIHGTANAGNGKSFYTASRGTASIVEYATGSYAPTGRQYTYKPANGTAYAEDVLVGSAAIYGLFSVQSGDAWRPGKLVWMDGQLSDKVQSFSSADMKPQAGEMTFLSDGRIAIAYRGNEGKGGIELFSGNTILSVISGDVSGDQYGEIPTLCSDGDKGLYFVGTLSNDVSALHRWKQDGTFSTLSSDLTGSSFKLAWDDSNKLLIMAMGSNIVIFKEDALFKTFDSLGGTVTSLALTASAGSTDSSSSNCSALVPGSLALLLLPLALLRQRRK